MESRDRESNSNSETAAPQTTAILPLQAALKALEETARAIPLGSTNLKHVNKAPTNSIKFKALKSTKGDEEVAYSSKSENSKSAKQGKTRIEKKEEDMIYSPKSLRHSFDKIIVYSPLFAKHPKYTGLDALTDESIHSIAKRRLDYIREKTLEIINMTQHMDTKSKRLLVRETLAKFAETYGVGNCEELATYAFLTLIKNDGHDCCQCRCTNGNTT